ncbi:MAG: right-handed parallel beta-helix repeat-containing protein [Bacteroidia bacterium]|nr:right-handed parallel beta-helix repeat-containing protein [Bacteroidia bacterium]
MSIINTTVSKCKAHTGGGTFEGGGGIYFSSCLNVKITNCIISENRTTGSGADGGGIYNCNYSDLNIRNCIISKNRAANTGGGYHGFSEGNLRIYNSSIYGNRAGPQGGGMMFQASALFEMDSCLIYNDTAIRAGGISIYGGGCRIANSSIYNNYARTYYGGGLVLSIVGGATLINNTISGNTAVTDGGGIWYQGRLILINNTISNNLAGQDGDGLFLNVGIPELPDLMMNNIFSNQRNYACLNNCVAPNSLGGNISSDTSMNNFLIDPTDKNNTDPLLDTLAFNGGVVPTLALNCTSPAINAGKYYHTYLGLTLHDTLYSPIRDQRGFLRIGNHDIGALESGTRTNTSLSACDSYTWAANGNIIYTKSGIYTTTLASRAGCDSVVTLNLTINFSPVLTTSVSGITITADETGATYQWIDCSNNSKIIGATSQTFTATANGNYAVVVTNKNCSDTSLCVSITSVGISQYPNINSKITIYPNPNTGKFILVTERISKNYWVTDNIGKVVAQGIIKQKQTDIDLSNSKAGIYFIQIDGQYFKLVVQ